MWTWCVRPILFRLEPERAHTWAMRGLATACALPGGQSLLRAMYSVRDRRLNVRVFGIDFESPVGLAAGFDKNAEWFNQLHSLGFGFIEVGTLTGLAQPGNPKPRLFRLPTDRALINRLGFNNKGSEAAARELVRRRIRPILGVNIGKSKVVPNEEANADYLASFERLWPFARYIAVNVSSPNTPGLRALQEREPLEALLRGLSRRNLELSEAHGAPARPILLKIAPDLNDAQVDDIVALCSEVGIAGIIATNTTLARQPLVTPADQVEAIGAGGLSGAPLTERSRQFVAALYRKTEGKMPIVGVGGIMSGEDAWQMIRAGASLVEVYTGFIYGGPGFVAGINRHLLRRLEETGCKSLGEVVGAAARP